MIFTPLLNKLVLKWIEIKSYLAMLQTLATKHWPICKHGNFLDKQDHLLRENIEITWRRVLSSSSSSLASQSVYFCLVVVVVTKAFSDFQSFLRFTLFENLD